MFVSGWSCRLRAAMGYALACGVCLQGAGAEAAPADKKQQCFSAHEQGQVARTARKHRAAAEQFAVCAQEACPAVVRDECSKWLTDARAAIPSVVPSAIDRQGRDVTNVKVSVDGEPLTEQLDGRAFELDPGEHTFVFVLADGTRHEQKFVLNEGERNRQVRGDFAPRTEKLPPPAASGRTPTAAYVLGGVGLVALGAAAVFGATGKSKEDDLQKTCAPNCSDDDVSSMNTRYLVADISLGVGIVSLGAAAWLLLRRPAAEPPPRAWIDVAPGSRGSGMVRLTTRF